MIDKRYKTKVCEQCGKSWETRTPDSRTCSQKCRALLWHKENPSSGRRKRDYPPEIVKRVGELHASGLSRAEVARIIGPGYSIQTILKRHFPRRRERGETPEIKRQVPARKEGNWKGDGASYTALHFRVEKERGKPQFCACCDISGPGRYEWANLTGEYTNVDDYIRLCVSCHRRLDLRRQQQLGCLTTEGTRR